MKLRLTLLDLAHRHKLDRHSTTELQTMAGLLGQPHWLPALLPAGAALLGASLLGLGIVFGIAANWDVFGRFGRLGLLQASIVASLAAAFMWPAWRAIAALPGLLAIGALLACVGQTYQTGADAWQMFALWTLLGLPICLAVRSDVLWMPWLLIAFSAIGLYVDQEHALAHSRTLAHAMGWASGALLCAGAMPLYRRFTGCGNWSMRLAAICTIAFAIHSCLHQLRGTMDASMLGMVMLASAAVLLARSPRPDLPAISILALGANVLFCVPRFAPCFPTYRGTFTCRSPCWLPPSSQPSRSPRIC